jgi:hypothetical protein
MIPRNTFNISFWTGATTAAERMRITSGGDVKIGGTSSDGRFYVKTASAVSYSSTSYMGTNASIRLETGGTPALNITTGIAFGIGGSAEAYIGAVQNSSAYADIVFQTYAGTYRERMRLSSSGVLNMYYTFYASADGECTIIDTNPSNSGSRRVLTVQGGIFGTSGDSSSKLIIFQANNGSELGSIKRDGGSGVSYLSSSDYRTKEDLKDFNGLDVISKIKTYDFKWKGTDLRNYGVIAHELQETLPYLVGGTKDQVNEEGKMVTQGVDYAKLTPILVKAIQEQQATITSLQTRIEQLENK